MPLIFIKGIVQGVGFRPTVFRVAQELGARGYVKNSGSNVEICIDTDPEDFMIELKNTLPPLARISEYRIEKTAYETPIDNHRMPYIDFRIISSSEGPRDSMIPADTATCPDCLAEILSSEGRRSGFPFTNCTYCGARFSLISGLPFDREKTAMRPFSLCNRCKAEYDNPLDRRFHAQTISCPDCGPGYTLFDRDGKPYLERKDIGIDEVPIRSFSKKIMNGDIGIMKGWGGFHIISVLEKAERIRDDFGRPGKPFAIMVRDIVSANKFAHLDTKAVELLTSPQRPIAIVQARDLDDHDSISPGLDSVGIFLPYSGAHHLLFEHSGAEALIMTSANLPGEPMITTNKAAFELNADWYLLHDRQIINRVDDSVIISSGGYQYFIRRSRGYVPSYYSLPHKKEIIALGGEFNLTGIIGHEGRAISTQYIGNAGNYGVLGFLKTSIDHLMELKDIRTIDAVGVDLHPGFPTRKLGEDIADKFDCPLLEIQHHHAHALSLMGDNSNFDEMVVLAIDGTGYGTDENIWGSEVLHSRLDGFKRHGSISMLPLIGGDKAVEDPRRIVFALCESLGLDLPYFDDGDSHVLRSLIKTAPRSSGMGRVLDALSCWLGICDTRTYDGEPAMRLEPHLRTGRNEGSPTLKGGVSPLLIGEDLQGYEPLLNSSQSNTINSSNLCIHKSKDYGIRDWGLFNNYEFYVELTSQDNVKRIDVHSLFGQLAEYVMPGMEMEAKKKADLAHSFTRALMGGLVDIAISIAETLGHDQIGITGGVSYNIPINMMIKDHLAKNDLRLATHSNVPNGDGGISYGQAIAMGALLP